MCILYMRLFYMGVGEHLGSVTSQIYSTIFQKCSYNGPWYDEFKEKHKPQSNIPFRNNGIHV